MTRTPEELNDLSGAVIGAAIEVHRELGPGLLESVYQEAFVHEIQERGYCVETEIDLPVRYKERELADRYRLDLLVDGELVIETKAVEEVSSVHRKQLLTYKELADCRLGLLVNFDESKVVDGIHRLVL